MVKIEFNNSDMPENRYLPNDREVTVIMDGCPSIAELVHLFRTFLYGLTYGEQTIDDYVGERE
jgi:hypothetical protein